MSGPNPNPAYVFGGLWPFVEAAAVARGMPVPPPGQGRTSWHLTQIQNALVQLRGQDPDSRRQAVEALAPIYRGLVAMAEGSGDAIRECCEAHDIPRPEWLEKETDGLHPAHDRGKLPDLGEPPGKGRRGVR